MQSFQLIATLALVASAASLQVYLADAAPQLANQGSSPYSPRVVAINQQVPIMLDAGKLKNEVQESLAKQLNDNLTPMHPPSKLSSPALTTPAQVGRHVPAKVAVQQPARAMVAAAHPFGGRPDELAKSPAHLKRKVKATPEQKALKRELMSLADRATGSDSNEQLLKFNPRTGQLEQVEADPSVEHYKKQLRKALKAISSKGLKVDKLKKALGQDEDDEHHHHHPHHQAPTVQSSGRWPMNARASRAQPLDELVRIDAPVAEPEPEIPTAQEIAAADEHHKLVDEVRENLHDRLNRISDLLYFRPEFMNQLLKVDDASEMTPVEAVFKRMILCNSDETFCHADLSDLARQLNEDPTGDAQIFAEPVHEFEPESEPEPIVEDEDEQGPPIPLPEYELEPLHEHTDFDHHEENTDDSANTAHFDGTHNHNGHFAQKTSASAYSYSHTKGRAQKGPTGRVQQLLNEQQQQQHNMKQQTVNGQTFMQQSGFTKASNQVADVASKARAAATASVRKANHVPLVARIVPQNVAQTPVNYKRPAQANKVPAYTASASAKAQTQYRQ